MLATDSVVAAMCGGKEKSKINDNKQRFLFQSWSTWAEENCLTKFDSNSNDEIFTIRDSTNSTLHHSKAPLYGTCPAQDEFSTVKCKQCGILLKPVAHRAHMNYRHNVLLKSPDVGGQFAWSFVISPPPPTCEPTTAAVVPKTGCATTASSSSSFSANNIDDNDNFTNNSCETKPVGVSLLQSKLEPEDPSTNLFDKFSIVNGESSNTSGRSMVKLKKPKPPPPVRRTVPPLLTGRVTTIPTGAKEKTMTKNEDYVVTQQSDHRLKITISKKALKEQPVTVHTTTKWTIPKMGLTTKKEPGTSRAKRTSSITVKRNVREPQQTCARFEKIDVKEYIDYCLPMSTTIGNNLTADTTTFSSPFDQSPLLNVVNADELYFTQKSQTKPVSFVKGGGIGLKQRQRRMSWDKNNNALHPKPVAVCSYGSRRFGAKNGYLFGRKNDLIRQAWEAALCDDFGNNGKLISTTSTIFKRNKRVKSFESATPSTSTNNASFYGLSSQQFLAPSSSSAESMGRVTIPVTVNNGSWCKMTSQNGTSRPLTVSVVPQDLLTQLLNNNNNNNNNNINNNSGGNSSVSTLNSGYNSNLTNGNTVAAANQRDKRNSTSFTTINLSNLTLSTAQSKITPHNASSSDYGSFNNNSGVGCFATVGRINAANVGAKRTNRKRADSNSSIIYGGGRTNGKRTKNSNLEIGPYPTAINQVIRRSKISPAIVGNYGATKSLLQQNAVAPTTSLRPLSTSPGVVQQSVIQKLLQSNATTIASTSSTPTVLTLPANAVILDGNKFYTVQNGPNGPQLVESGSADGANLQSVLNAYGGDYSMHSSPSTSSTPPTIAGRAIQPKFVSPDVLQHAAAKVPNGIIGVNQQQQLQLQSSSSPYKYPQTVVACSVGQSDGFTTISSSQNCHFQQQQQQPLVVNIRSQSKGNVANHGNCRPPQINSVAGAVPLIRFAVSNASNSSSASPSPLSAVTVISGLRTSVTAPVLVRTASGGVQQNNNNNNNNNNQQHLLNQQQQQQTTSTMNNNNNLPNAPSILGNTYILTRSNNNPPPPTGNVNTTNNGVLISSNSASSSIVNDGQQQYYVSFSLNSASNSNNNNNINTQNQRAFQMQRS